MKAAVYYQNGEPEVFRYEDVADPVCGPDEVPIRVDAISIEGGDLVNREIRPLARVPHIVGYQCAGTISETGHNVRGRHVGDRSGLPNCRAPSRARVARETSVACSSLSWV
jgi:NADPH2:quinone reductase